MSRLTIDRPSSAQAVIDSLCADISRRLEVNPAGNCPLEISSAFLRLCASQSCGKCVPCRIGLGRMADIIDSMLEGSADAHDLATLEATAQTVYQTADCAIGFEAGRIAQASVAAFKDDYLSHVDEHHCITSFKAVPCTDACPAHVDVPAYIACVKAGRLEDAIRIIRNDNPFPSVCAYICEHPCESSCRRTMVDDAVNIRGIKKYAVDNTKALVAPAPLPATGKSIAIVGGGPSGLTCAYYLRLMGHDVTVFERQDRLGGMLLYGIPRYRLPEEALAYDIDTILATGVKVEYSTEVGDALPFEKLAEDFDGIYIAIGAHTSKKIGIEGEDLPGVYSAVEVLRETSGGGAEIDMAGKDVVVIGGGNVAMDVTRTARRLGAASVKCIYRRRLQDMTALPAEVESAIAENCEMVTLMAPVAIQSGTDKPLVLVAQPQIPGAYAQGRPKPVAADAEPMEIACDIIIAAIGQDIVSGPFAASGLTVERNRFVYDDSQAAHGKENIFVGGDCATGPATVIRTISAGKIAAANIDEFLGFAHDVHDDVEIPTALFSSATPCGRVNVEERPAPERAQDFEAVEEAITAQEALQECGRCLRCDVYGYGAFRGGRSSRW